MVSRPAGMLAGRIRSLRILRMIASRCDKIDSKKSTPGDAGNIIRGSDRPLELARSAALGNSKPSPEPSLSPTSPVPSNWQPARMYRGLPWRPPGTNAVIFDIDAVRDAADRVPMKLPGIVAFTIGIYPALARHANRYGVVTDPVDVIRRSFPAGSTPKNKVRAALWLLESGGLIARIDISAGDSTVQNGRR